jgi:membrane protease YdiL (CAAX protease family)
VVNRELTWLLAAILVGAGIFLAVAVAAAVGGAKRLAQRARRRAASAAAGIEPIPKSEPSQPAWYAVLWLVLLSAAAALLAASLLVRLIPESSQAGFWFYWRGLVLPEVALCLTVLISDVAKFTHLGDSLTQVKPFPGWRKAGIWLLVGVGLWLAAVFIQRIQAVLTSAAASGGSAPFQVSLLSVLPAPGGNKGAWVVCAWLVLVSPLVEELFFRGALLPALSRRWGSRLGWLASSLAAAFFALNLPALPALLLVNLGFGWLSRIHSPARSLQPDLWAPWLAHTALNMMVVASWWWA